MRYKILKFTSLITIVALLAACNVTSSEQPASNGSSLTSQEPNTSISEGSVSSEAPLTSQEPVTSISDEPLSSIPSEDVTSTPSLEEGVDLDLFALNDLHGSISFLEGTQNEWGLYKMGSYLRQKELENPGGVINMDVGDIWQGSADSNITKGKVIIEMFNSLNWAATTLGNHEFDWYDTVIEENKEIAEYPFLGANIISKSDGQLADNIVDGPSTMIERNGVKVGIIGTIGSSLESSILASAVEPYSFEPVTDYIIDASNDLKEQGANLIILLTHESLTGYSSYGQYGPVIEPVGREPYVDVVFTGHAHAFDRQIVNGVPILQTNGNGKQLMHVNLTVSEEGVVINEYTHITNELMSYPDDPQLLAVFDKYADQISAVKDEVIGELTYYMDKNQLLQLAVKTMLEEAQKTYNVDVAYHNSAGVRVNSIAAGEVTFGDIYKAFPFDNTIQVIQNVPGTKVRNYSGNSAYYRQGLSSSTVDPNAFYTVVTINYVSESDYVLSNLPQTTIPNIFVRDTVANYFREKGVVNPYQL